MRFNFIQLRTALLLAVMLIAGNVSAVSFHCADETVLGSALAESNNIKTSHCEEMDTVMSAALLSADQPHCQHDCDCDLGGVSAPVMMEQSDAVHSVQLVWMSNAVVTRTIHRIETLYRPPTSW